jgi:glutathione S-transferase
MKLVGSQGSPFARKVRVVMAEKKIDCQFESINVAESHAQTQQFNPLGKVPYLMLDDGEVLFDSRVIVEYLDNLTPVQRLIPASGRERAEVKVWEALADGMLDAVGLIRLESMRSESQRSEPWVAKQQSKVDAALAALSTRLGDHPFCVDGRYSLADIAVACALGYLQWRVPQNNWREQYPNLRVLADKLFARASFADTMPPSA